MMGGIVRSLFRNGFFWVGAALAVLAVSWIGMSLYPKPPAFDCSNRQSALERSLCSDERVEDLALAVESVVQDRQVGGSEAEAQRWAAEQRQWADGLAKACALSDKTPLDAAARGRAVSCLADEYQKRLATLAVPAGHTAAAVWPGGMGDARVTLARIQSDLERVAVGKSRWTLPEGGKPDALERIVDAYAAFLKNDMAAMDAILKEVARSVVDRPLPEAIRKHYPESDINKYLDNRSKYFKYLGVFSSNSSPLMRLIADIRYVDSVFFFEAADTAYSVDFEKRHMPDSKAAHNMWLRLPCRTVLGRASDFTQTKAALGDHAGPLLSCPSSEEDFARLETLAAHPDRFIPRPVEPAASIPEEDVESTQLSEQEKAVQDMAENPDAVEPILKAAAEKNDTAALDYALFIHAFRPATPENKERIIQLLDPVIQAVAAQNPDGEAESLDAYDGTDLSLESILRVLSVEGNTTGSYTIPCAVLIARPELIEATVGYYASSRDNFVPTSGCASNKGDVKDFPIKIVKDYMNVSKYADGNFIDDHGGTIVYSHIATINSYVESLKINPKSYISHEHADFSYPYQTWGMTGAVADEIAKRIRLTYREAHEALTAYNVRHGLSPEDAALAAKQGLFDIVFGATCGGGVPERSIRGMLIKGAPVKAILAQRQLPDDGEAPEVLKCADYATLDPLLHVAVLHPAALSALLDQGEDIEQPNPIGKTPLMTAAHLDRLDSVARLLMRGARVEAMTLSPQRDYEHPQLKHDVRSPLMYAASSGTLATITLLLDAGADPYRADSKGRRAIDYLLGYGPVRANPLLSDEERAEAIRRLF